MRHSRNTAIAAALVAVIVLAASPVSAQISIELQGGPAFPTGDLNEYWGIGFTGGGTILYELTPFVSFGVNLQYSRMGLDTKKFQDDISGDEWDISGGATTLFSACGEVRAHAGAMDFATLFAGVGFGYFQVGLTDLEGTYGGDTESITFDSESQPGGYVHAGAAFSLSPMIKLGIKGQMTFYRFKNEDVADIFDYSEGRNFFSLMGALIIGF